MGLSNDKGYKKTKDIENKKTEALDKKALIKENVVNVRSELFVKKISDVWQRTAIFVRNGLVDDK